jgi:hypothetical protein
MFCSECGATAHGKFCSSCGTALMPVAAETANLVSTPVEWSDIIDCQTLLAIPEVRDLIARAASQAKKGVSGEEILEAFGKVIAKLAGLPVSLPMTGLAHFAQATYAKMGIKTGKSRVEFVAEPTGRVIVELLCSLARHGCELRVVHQITDGVILGAVLPSDLFALEGNLILTVTRVQGGTQVEARTEIPGQIFDWGKSNRCLEAIFAELNSPRAA